MPESIYSKAEHKLTITPKKRLNKAKMRIDSEESSPNENVNVENGSKF